MWKQPSAIASASASAWWGRRFPNGAAGVSIGGESSDNTIGGTAPGAHNIISGNNGPGIEISGSAATTKAVEGHYIGTNPTGQLAMGNASGVMIDGGASNNVIGGS